MKLKGRWLVKILAVALSLFMVMGSLTINEVKAAQADADGYNATSTLCGGTAGQVHWYCYDAVSEPRATLGVKLKIVPESGTKMLNYSHDEFGYYYDDGSDYGETRHYDDYTVCESLQFVDIASGITYIGTYAFAGFSTLKKIRIPASVNSIGANAIPSGASITIICEKGSYAETFATSNGNTIQYTDGSTGGGGGSVIPGVPDNLRIEQDGNTVKASWDAAANAEGYYVCYSKIGDTDKLAYTTNTSTQFFVNYGVQYQVYVYAVNGSNSSGYNTIKYILCLETPSNLTAVTTSSGTTLNWSAVTGAEQYIVKRNGTQITVTNATTAFDSTANSEGTNYSYEVYAIATTNDGNTVSSKAKACQSTAYTTKPAAPQISIRYPAGMVSIDWAAVDQASSYRVYRNDILIDTLLSSSITWYEDSAINNATEYTYQVTAVKDDVESSRSNSVKGMALVVKPTMIKVENNNNTFNISWNKADGATGYDIVWSNDSGVVTKSVAGGDNITASYSSSEVGSNPRDFCVRAKRDYNSGVIYSVLSDKINATDIISPTLQDVELKSNEVSLTWRAEAGAERYKVYECNSNNQTELIATIAATNVKLFRTYMANTEYKFYVVAEYSGGTLSQQSNAISAKYINSAKISGVELSANGASAVIRLNNGDGTEGVNGADGYEIRANGTVIGSITASDLTSKKRYITGNFECGIGYTFTAYAYYIKDGVRKYADASNTVTTAWIGTPQNVEAVTSAAGTIVRWNAATGATQYVVKINGNTSSTFSSDTAEYTDKTANVAGTKYQCEVIALYNLQQKTSVTVSSMYLNKATITNVDAKSNSTDVSWSSVAGAEQYIVYKNGGTEEYWSGTGTSFTDAAANVAGQMCSYSVEAVAYIGGIKFSSGKSSVATDLYVTKPQITEVNVASDKATIRWNASEGATKYNVYRTGTNYSIATVSECSYADNGYKSPATEYGYYVVPVVADNYNDIEINKAKSDTKSGMYIEAPANCKVETDSEKGTKITWNSVTGAEKYYIQKVGTSTTIQVGTATEFTIETDKDTSYGYSYYVIAEKNFNGQAISSSTLVSTIARLNTPVLTSAVTGENGTEVTWQPVSGAVYYRLLVDGVEQDEEIGTCTYLDENNRFPYVKHSYSVRAYISEEVKSEISNSKDTIKQLSKPIISSVTMVSGKAVVKWNAVAEATSYTVKYGTTEYNVGNNTTFSDPTSLAEGKQYSYYVTANGDDCDSVRSDVKILKTPVAISSATLKLATVEIKWTKPSYSFGKYIIERKAGSGEYTVIASNVASTATSYVDKSLKAGTTYSYRVRTDVSAAGRVKAVKISASPVVTTYNTSTGTVVKWTAVSGAKKYRLERRIGTGSYATISTGLTGTTYTDNVAKVAGTTYTYRVIVDGISIYGTSKLHTFVPTNTAKVTNAAKGILVSWTRVNCATGYIIYRKAGSGSYVRLATITKGTTLSYTDTTAKSGVLYTYYTRPFRNNSDGSISYAPGSKSVKTLFVAVPTVKAVSAGASGTTVIWNKVSGVNGYRIYRKIGSGKYALIKTVSSSVSSYLDKGAKTNGTAYTYCIVGYRAYSGVTYKSATAGYKTNIYLTAPVIKIAVNNGTGKVTTTWSRNTKATGYIFRYFIGSKYKDITITSNATLARAITSIKKGSVVKVYVRAYKTVSGVKYYSAWSAGKALKTTR